MQEQREQQPQSGSDSVHQVVAVDTGTSVKGDSASRSGTATSAARAKASHTPGPWTVRSVPFDDEPQCEYTQHYIEPRVAEIFYVTEDGAANARLIAAAPDLLAEHTAWAKSFGGALVLALQGDYSEVDRLAQGMRIDFPDCTATLRSAAIARALGESA